MGWAFVNLFHRSAERKGAALDRATDEVRPLVATADGSEVHTHGVLERHVIEAKARKVTVVDRRGPLGTSPKAPGNAGPG